jgi:hypothetical protein
MKNQQSTKNVSTKNVETKKENLTNANANVISQQIAKGKYKIDYSQLSSKKQKEERGKRRRKLLGFSEGLFQINHLQDAKEKGEQLKELKKNVLSFFKETYSFDINISTNADSLYKTNDATKLRDVKELIQFAFSK